MLKRRMIALLYLIYRCGGKIVSRKKLQKLVFLTEYYLDNSKVSTSKLTNDLNYNFIIYYYGPFSWELYADVDMLVDKGYLIEKYQHGDIYDEFIKGYYIYELTENGIKKALNYKGDDFERINRIINLFKDKNADELEKICYKLLNLNEKLKDKVFGYSTEEYLKKYLK